MTEKTDDKTRGSNILVLLIAALIAAVLLSSYWLSFSNRVSTKREKAFDAATTAKLEEALRETVSRFSIPGIIVGVWVPGQGSWTAASGVSDTSTGAKMSVDNKFCIASITKSFVATVILQLVDQKFLSLDDTLNRYFPDIPAIGSITVRQLLDHTSGLFDFKDDPTLLSECESRPMRVKTPRSLLDASLANPPYFPPGAGWRYSNTNYVVLSMVAEKVTGEKLEDMVKQRIIVPLGLKNTEVSVTTPSSGMAVKTYSWSDGSLVPFPQVHPSLGWGSTSMVSDLEDMKTWAGALGRGELVSEAMQAERTRFLDTGRNEPEYGLGLSRWGEYVGHAGNAYGNSSFIGYLPGRQATFVVYMNLFPEHVSAPQIFDRLAKVVFPDVPTVVP